MITFCSVHMIIADYTCTECFLIFDVIVFPRVGFMHYKLKLCRKTSAPMNKDHICQAVSKPTPRPTKFKKISGHFSVKVSSSILRKYFLVISPRF